MSTASEKARADGWCGGTPPVTGHYWVNLEREPGRIRLFFFYVGDVDFHPGWSTDRDIHGPTPAWANTQTPLLEVFGPVRWWKSANDDMPRLDSLA